MKRAELRDELERLGHRPVPLPDPRRVDALEDRLYREFVVAPAPSARSRMVAARRRRRQVLVAGIGLAAVATAAVAILHRGGRPGFELETATGAVVLLPGGQSRAARAGDQIPSGGLLQTGPTGSVTIDGTKIGPAQMVLLGDEGLTLLPAPTATVPASSTAPAAEEPAPTAPATQPRPGTTAAPAPKPTTAAVEPPPPVDPVPMAAMPLAALALTVGEDNGGVHLAWSPSDAESFSRYVVARGTTATNQLEDIAELSDRQITSFTDPAAPHGVELLYQIVALGSDGRPVGVSDQVQLTLQNGDPSSSVPGDATSTSEPSGSVLTIPPSTDGSTTSTEPTSTGPDSTGPGTSAPPSTEPLPTDNPPADAPTSSGPPQNQPPSTVAPNPTPTPTPTSGPGRP